MYRETLEVSAKARVAQIAAVDLANELEDFLRRNKIHVPWWKRWLEARILR